MYLRRNTIMSNNVMRKVWAGLSLGMVVLGLFVVSMPAFAQTNDPESVIRGIVEALNSGDIDSALNLVAEDSVITLFPAPPGTNGVFVGKEEIRGWWESFTAAHGSSEITSFSAQGNTATWKATVSDDILQSLGLGSAEFDGVGIVQNGLLKTYAWSMTDEAMAALEAALVRTTNTMLAERYMEELWNQGNVDVADELLAPDFVDHTPRPGMGSDREALKADIAGFHQAFPDQSAHFSVDDIIAAEDKAVVRGTLTLPAAEDSAEAQETGYIVILGLEDRQISERWATFIGWGE
jgi:ketosteroid isomerase-like protein